MKKHHQLHNEGAVMPPDTAIEQSRDSSPVRARACRILQKGGNPRSAVALGTILLLLLCSALVSFAQPTVVWQDDFESATVWDNWSVDNGVWEIGAPTTGPTTNSAGYRAHEGTNCAATVLAGNYPASTSSRLMRTLPFVVPSASQNPRLEFWHWYQFSGNSYGVVQIKYGANDWTDLSPRYYATGSGVWTRPVVDLSAYAGKAVYLAFQIVADGNVADGWDVDEVRVIKGPYTVGFTNGLAESFELGLGDWSAEEGTWEVGVPTSGPSTNALGQRAYAGTNCVATVLRGNYPDGVDSSFVSPPFIVPPSGDYPRLSFMHWFQFDSGDYGVVQVKAGTNAWQEVGLQFRGNGGGGSAWNYGTVDLSAYAGQQIQVAFKFHSENVYHYYGDGNQEVGPGWYLDQVAIKTGIPVLAGLEGFEAGWGDWSADGGLWEVGVPTYGPATNALGRRAHEGTNCAATILGGDYPDQYDYAGGTDSRLVSPVFIVPLATQYPRLTFWHWFQFDSGDYGVVQVKAGTNAWQEVGLQFRGNGGGGSAWNYGTVDLSAYAGQQIQVAFKFHSENVYHYYGDGNQEVGPGWYLDQVAIKTGIPVLAGLEGFEAGWGDWSADGGLWEVGVPTYGPATNALGRRAHEGTNCAATILGGDYPDQYDYAGGTDSRLVSPVFIVPSLGNHPRLRFWHWFLFNSGDYGLIQVKAGANDWQDFTAHFTGSGGVWSPGNLDLSAYAGQQIQVGFKFHSENVYLYYGDGSQEVDPGWYLDEVTVTSVTPPTGIVEFTDARYFINEGETSATITVERKYGGAGAVNVTYIATDGTAAGGDDFDSAVDTLSWADGEQGVRSFTVPIHQDALVEGNETVTLQLAVPGALASSVARETATLVIIDDDGVLPLSTNIAYLRSLVVTPNYVATNTTSLFTVDGTVTTYTNLSTTAADELFFMQDDTNGIAVLFRGGTSQFMPQAGDRLRVTAAVTNINGLLALAPNYANITNYVWPLSAGNTLPVPVALDFASRTNVPVMEAMESRYVSASQVMIDQTGGGTFPLVATNLVVTNQSGADVQLND